MVIGSMHKVPRGAAILVAVAVAYVVSRCVAWLARRRDRD
jgi:hypothetical protein